MKDNKNLVWNLQLPTDKSGDLKVIGFYDAEYQPNHTMVCSYQIANSNEGVALLGYFFVKKPLWVTVDAI